VIWPAPGFGSVAPSSPLPRAAPSRVIAGSRLGEIKPGMGGEGEFWGAWVDRFGPGSGSDFPYFVEKTLVIEQKFE
jgi:hypothetical protein